MASKDNKAGSKTSNATNEVMTVSAKKRLAEKSFRNVLALPYEKYWPLLEGEDAVQLLAALKRVLCKIHLQKNQVPRQSLVGKSADERKKLKKSLHEELLAKDEYKEATRIRSQLLIGVNAVSKGLQRHTVSACIVSSDASPVMIASNVLHAAAASRVPVVVLDSLKEHSSTTMGFACLAIAIKSEHSDDPLLVELVQKVTQLSSKFPLTESLRILSSEPALEQVNPEPNVKPKTPTMLEVKVLHLQRPSDGERAFKPPIQSNSVGTDFIALGADDTSAQPHHHEPMLPFRPTTKKPTSKYQPLVVKRLQPNPDKIRDKQKRKKKKQKQKNEDR